ncbi:MAG: hypothetical protein QOJ94_2104 [Sphingomonadales bacterium]|jgi:hypothetical protein|nr:hypothetical protein [Sphingomonadales bacterium]
MKVHSNEHEPVSSAPHCSALSGGQGDLLT